MPRRENVGPTYEKLRVKIPKELNKLVTKALKALLFEIKAILGPLGHNHVFNSGGFQSITSECKVRSS